MKNAPLTISDLKNNPARAVAQVEKTGFRGITRHGRAVAFLISRDVLESILETMELQKNPALMKQVRLYRAGKLKFTPLTDEDSD
jgi:prevent-host-death family protein